MPELSKDAGGLVTMIDKVAVGPNVNGEITYIHVDPLGPPASKSHLSFASGKHIYDN